MVDEILRSLRGIDENLDHEKLEARVKLSIPGDSIVFKGHFPERPLLAGAYQLLLAVHWLKKLLNENITTERISEAKFRSLIGPEEEFLLEIKVEPDYTEDSRYRVRSKIIKDGKAAMSATLFVNKIII